MIRTDRTGQVQNENWLKPVRTINETGNWFLDQLLEFYM